MADVTEGPDDGHTFRISFESRGSYWSPGASHPTDSPSFDGIVHTVEVRAWSLHDALLKAANLPFNVLMAEDNMTMTGASTQAATEKFDQQMNDGDQRHGDREAAREEKS